MLHAVVHPGGKQATRLEVEPESSRVAARPAVSGGHGAAMTAWRPPAQPGRSRRDVVELGSNCWKSSSKIFGADTSAVLIQNQQEPEGLWDRLRALGRVQQNDAPQACACAR